MKWIKCSNKIEIEPNAFKLIGACTKREDESKIGFFGSGLKYALAVFLRNGIDIKVFAGKQEISIGCVTDRLRDQEFDVITIDGDKTSMTTSMGPKWEPWQAIREVYCNALDEGGTAKVGTCEPCGIGGETNIFISAEHEEVAEVTDNWDKYFSFNRVALAECDHGAIYDRLYGTVYRKGIRCVKDDITRTLFDYETSKVELNESRVIDSPYSLPLYMCRVLAKSADQSVIDKIVKDRVSKEFQADWDYSSIELNGEWLKYFEGKILIPESFAGHFSVLVEDENSVIIKRSLILKLQKTFGKEKFRAVMSGYCAGSDYVESKPDRKRDYLLKEAKSFLDQVGLNCTYECKIVSFSSKKIIGAAHEGLILLSETLFDKGKRQIVLVIMEEWAHLESGKGDETRDFQNFLMEQMLTLLENQHGVFL